MLMYFSGLKNFSVGTSPIKYNIGIAKRTNKKVEIKEYLVAVKSYHKNYASEKNSAKILPI